MRCMELTSRAKYQKRCRKLKIMLKKKREWDRAQTWKKWKWEFALKEWQGLITLCLVKLPKEPDLTIPMTPALSWTYGKFQRQSGFFSWQLPKVGDSAFKGKRAHPIPPCCISWSSLDKSEKELTQIHKSDSSQQKRQKHLHLAQPSLSGHCVVTSLHRCHTSRWFAMQRFCPQIQIYWKNDSHWAINELKELQSRPHLLPLRHVFSCSLEKKIHFCRVDNGWDWLSLVFCVQAGCGRPRVLSNPGVQVLSCSLGIFPYFLSFFGSGFKKSWIKTPWWVWTSREWVSWIFFLCIFTFNGV